MNLLSYKGYNAAVEFDADDLILVGRVAGINDVVGFHGRDADAIVAAFHEAVDHYLEACASIGKAPEKAYSGKLMIRTEPGIHAQAALAATLEGGQPQPVRRAGAEGSRGGNGAPQGAGDCLTVIIVCLRPERLDRPARIWAPGNPAAASGPGPPLPRRRARR